MPDITMCKSTHCYKRSTCYRNTASGTVDGEHRQAYFMRNPDHKKEWTPESLEQCYLYLPIGKEKE